MERVRSISIQLCLLSAVLLVAGPLTAQERVVDSTLAVVNGKVITLGEIMEKIKPLIEKARQDSDEAQYKARTEALIGLELTNRKNEILLGDEAERVLEKEAKDQVTKHVEGEVKDEAAKAGSLAAFQAKLKESGKTLEDFKRDKRTRLLVDVLLYREVYSKVKVRPARILEYYETHPEEFFRKESAAVQQILLSFDEYRGEPEARQAAEKVYAEARSGGDFAALARKWSDGPYAKEGGLWGAVERGSLVREVDQVIFSMMPGAVTPVIRSRVGFHILRVIDLKPSRTLTYDEAQGEIERKLRVEEIRAFQADYLKKVERNSYVQVLWKSGGD